MSKDREEIQRYETYGHEILAKAPDGAAVLYADHLRVVKLAQIEVLEEASKLTCKRCDSGDPFPHKKNQNPYNTAKTLCHAARIHALIAALKKELEG